MKLENSRKNSKNLENIRYAPVLRGEIYYVDFGSPTGSEQGGVRPAIIVQNDIGNKYSPTVIVAAITSKISKNRLPTHISISSGATGLPADSIILLEQIRTIDKSRLGKVIGSVDSNTMRQMDRAVAVSFGIRQTSVA